MNIAGMETACTLLEELSRARRELLDQANQLGSNAQDARQLIMAHGEWFVSIEDLSERADEMGDNSDELKKRLEATVTFGIAPIHLAASILHPLFLPIVFKTSTFVTMR